MKKTIKNVLLIAGLILFAAFPYACAGGADLQKNSNTIKPITEKPAADKQVETGDSGNAATDEKNKTKSPDIPAILKATVIKELKIELEAYNGDILIESLTEPGTLVKEGEVVARVSLPEYYFILDNSARKLEAQEISLRANTEEYNRELENGAYELDKAKNCLKVAQDSLDNWNREEKADLIASRELDIQRQRYSIEDQKDELDQLEKLYEGNELAKESQEIVLKRARRQLELSEKRLELGERGHKRFLEFEIPETSKKKEFAVKSAAIDMDKLVCKQKMYYPDKKSNLTKEEVSAREAKQKHQELIEDGERLLVKAPVSGVAMVGSVEGNPEVSAKLKLGDKVSNRAVLVSIIDTAVLEVELCVPVKKALKIDIGSKVKMKIKSLDLCIEGTVKARGLTVKNDKLTLLIKVDNKDHALLPGLSAEGVFLEE
ncbi:MAG: HlyD family efflux transporter periplasmic adaptor subunit [Planctomycetota bacterium]